MSTRPLALLLLLAAALTGATKKTARTDPPPAKVLREDVIAHLEESIAWYRAVNAAEQLTGIPSDLVVHDATLQRTLQSLQLAFDFARAEAAFLAAEKQAANPALPQDSQDGRTLVNAAARAAEEVAKVQAQWNAALAELAKPGLKNRPLVEARERELKAELSLTKQALTTIQGMINIASDSAPGQEKSSGLRNQIDTLERSVPEARHMPKNAIPSVKPPAQQSVSESIRPDRAGFVVLITELTSLIRARGQLDELLTSTDLLLRNIDRLKNPLVTALRSSIERGRALAESSGSDDIDELDAGRQEIEQLTARFQHISTATVPIGEQQLLIETVRGNLSGWRASIARQANETGKYLLLRGGLMFAAILLVIFISEGWRRGTLRYVTDPRRRRQFVVLRRTGVTLAITLIVTLSFVTDFSSIATYAGFLTAGVALGLQNVILSVVAYFFLIGKYGIKSGDRVTISGVTGDVIDVGLVRLYMMELTGPELRPSGRTVVYANSIVFQPSALFKQIPGADFVWHKATVILDAATDFDLAKKALTQAVHEAYAHFREEIILQHSNFETSLDLSLAAPEPACTAAFTEAGLEFHVQYPASLKRASEMDERVLQALRDAIAANPALQLVAAPKLG